MNDAPSANHAWLQHANLIALHGDQVAARTMQTLELQHQTLICDMRRPVVTCAERKLSYRFMVAEAFWILSGDDSVAGIAPFNKKILDYSDDGISFFGAYGPRIQEQLQHCVHKLLADAGTRQAVITTWRPNPPETKDVPCTVAFCFQLRHGRLDLSVFMRSSDAWLGVPYDIFNFSMLAHLVCARYNGHRAKPISPGLLRLTMASAHLYERDVAKVHQLTMTGDLADPQPNTGKILYTNEAALMMELDTLRTHPEEGWWEP